MRVKGLAREDNKKSLGRARTRIACSSVKCTNHEASQVALNFPCAEQDLACSFNALDWGQTTCLIIYHLGR